VSSLASFGFERTLAIHDSSVVLIAAVAISEAAIEAGLWIADLRLTAA
jgi:hypothetical protein